MRQPLAFGPHWYSAVMGTGVMTLVLEGLPFSVPGAGAVALAFWMLSVLLLVAVTAVLVGHLRRDRAMLGRHVDDPAMAPFFGAPAMAVLTVSAGATAAGHTLLGPALAVQADAVLWTLGTVLGLVTAVGVPYRTIVHHEVADDSATGGWLMPVVPPMVSATTGAALVPHLPAGQAQETLLLVCYALFGLTVISGFLVLNQLWHRLVRHGTLAPASGPTVWIVLGFLGQSTTAAHHLGALAPALVPQYGDALGMLAICYGVPVWGFTMLWLALAMALTARQLRAGLLPYAPSWWSFTFPVGAVATGTSALAAATGLVIFELAAGLLLALLVAGWVAATLGTVRALRIGVQAALPPQPVREPTTEPAQNRVEEATGDAVAA